MEVCLGGMRESSERDTPPVEIAGRGGLGRSRAGGTLRYTRPQSDHHEMGDRSNTDSGHTGGTLKRW